MQLLEVAQTAMNQFRAGRGGVCGEIVLLAQQDRQATAGRVARDARAVDPAADDKKVITFHLTHLAMHENCVHRLEHA